LVYKVNNFNIMLETFVQFFYRPTHEHLIVVPFRNGTTHLNSNTTSYGLHNITQDHLIDNVFEKAKKKTFIYRDPFLRLMSFYNAFVYKPYVTKEQLESEGVKNASDCFAPPVRGHDLLSDMIFAKNNIIKNYKTHDHIQPQYSYFKHDIFNQNLEEYEIISVSQYTEWIHLTFADTDFKYVPSEISEINLNIESTVYLQNMYNMCKYLYKEDYKFLEPRIILI